MKAVLIATGYVQEMEPLVRYRPTPLINIVDKPIIIHIIEFLVRHGIVEFEIVLSHLPNLIEDRLEEGDRWGISITYHLVREPEHPFSILRVISESWKDNCILLGQGDILPRLESKFLTSPSTEANTLFMSHSGEWLGWGFFTPKTLTNLPAGLLEEDLPHYLKGSYKTIKTHPFISTRKMWDLRQSNQKFLNQPSTSGLFPATAQEVEPGIWVSHAVSIRPGLKVEAPIFIGENCQIRENVSLGPNTVIENNCIIDKGSIIGESIICQRSYVGEGLAIQSSIVDRNFLANLAHATTLVIRDDFILSGLTQPKLFNLPYDIFKRLSALSLFILFLPVYLWLSRKCDLKEADMLSLPASEHRFKWKTFKWRSFIPKAGKKLTLFQTWFQRLPLLLNIFKGDVHFIGTSPRSTEDAQKMPIDWQKLYFRSKVGLITLADLDHGPHPTLDDMYASETYYATRMGIFYDLKLILRWLAKKMLSRQKYFNKGSRHAS